MTFCGLQQSFRHLKIVHLKLIRLPILFNYHFKLTSVGSWCPNCSCKFFLNSIFYIRYLKMRPIYILFFCHIVLFNYNFYERSLFREKNMKILAKEILFQNRNNAIFDQNFSANMNISVSYSSKTFYSFSLRFISFQGNS